MLGLPQLDSDAQARDREHASLLCSRGPRGTAGRLTEADDPTLARIFRAGRTYTAWQRRPVEASLLREVWDLARLGPTSANSSPARIVFVISAEAKARLKPSLIAGNVDKTMSAPATAIIAHDLKFYDRLPELFPHTDALSWFVGNDRLIETTAFRNGSLQGAYFILAARALGLDCGPMSGFDNAMVDAEFFSGTSIRSNFLCNIGYGDPDSLRPRGPRLEFDDACSVV
ncbi:MAG: malonic semialdehyde reductase [Rhodospirillales bacterium]|nr:malonic semialdehyde reductase [Rhodospirillales bacterium]